MSVHQPKVDPSEEKFLFGTNAFERDIIDFFRELFKLSEDFTSDTLKPMYDKIKNATKSTSKAIRDYYVTSLVQIDRVYEN